MEVFWSRGYTGTSVSDLLEATDLSRSSLYQTFSSKEALFRDCIRRYCDTTVQQLQSDLDHASSGRAFIEQTFLNVARRADDPQMRRGCLAMNTAMELGDQHSGISKEVHTGLLRFADVFAAAVQQAQAEGDITGSKSAGELGRYLVSSMCGLRMFIKSGMRPEEVERIVRIIIQSLD